MRSRCCCTRLILGSNLSANSLTSLEGFADYGGGGASQTFSLLNGLVALENLDLTGNGIDTLEAGVFEDCGALQTLCVCSDSDVD